MSNFYRDPVSLKSHIATSMGMSPPDLLLTGAQIVNTLTGEMYFADVAIKDERIVRVGDVNDIIENYSETKIIDCTDSYLIPGLIDAHLHTESTLMTPTRFTEVALPRGTTTVAVDPHEIGNVLGIPGLELFVEEVKNLPLEFLVEIPSCVPAAPTLETGPNIISAEEYKPLLADDRFYALAEMMNFPGVIYGDDEVVKKLSYAEQAGKIREGHAPGLRGKELQAYVTAGVSSDHESYTTEEVIEKLRAGCRIQLREGSFARNLVELASGIKEQMGDAKNPWDQVIICTDDKHADDILYHGHLDHSLRLLVNTVGLDPITAVQICTINPARHLMRPDLGAIAPGRIANIVRVNNLKEFEVVDVISQGVYVAHEHQLLLQLPEKSYPEWVLDTVRPNFIPKKKDFFIESPAENGKLEAHVIGVIEHSLVTDHFVEKVKIENSRVILGEGQAYYFLLDRHAKTNNFAKSIVRGFGFVGEAAVASTVAHDSHQLLITGNSPECMEHALNLLIDAKGGQVIVRKKDGKMESKLLPLPYAGLMSTLKPKEIAETMLEMKEFSKEVCPGITDPFMSLSFMALPVIPKLKLTDKGLVDVEKFELINLFT